MKKHSSSIRSLILACSVVSAIVLPGTYSLAGAEEASEPAAPYSTGYRVLIDAGHQGPNVDMSDKEPNGPGSTNMKTKASQGTVGSFTGIPEYQLNLDIALMLDSELQQRGYETVLTRKDNDTAISNKERGELAAAQGCDISVRIHANGSDSPAVSGALTMSPSESNPYVAYLYPESYRLSRCVIDAYCAKTGFTNCGVSLVDNMTGFNWCSVPVTLIEMGYMTNESDDTRMSDPAVRVQMVEGIADGIDEYFGIDRAAYAEASFPGAEPAPEDSVTQEDADLSMQGILAPPSGSDDSSFSANASDERVAEILDQINAQLPQGNGSWAVYVCNLANDTADSINNSPMQAASLIKLFIMGAVYERYDSLAAAYGADNLNTNLNAMITVSDNTSANTLVGYLGGGDTGAGMDAVNQFCTDHQYMMTSMGRLLLESNEHGDNYTSVEDCGRFLKDVYLGAAGFTESPELSHTSEMFSLLRKQTKLNKIPSQMPAGVSTASKTGELANVENDAAIIFNTPSADLVIVFMSEDLANAGSAQTSIGGLSRAIYDFFNG